MKLSEREQSMLFKLEKQQARWEFSRWIILPVCVLLWFSNLLGFSDDNLFAVLGAAGFVMTLYNWNGRPETVLILKLVQEATQRGSKEIETNPMER